MELKIKVVLALIIKFNNGRFTVHVRKLTGTHLFI